MFGTIIIEDVNGNNVSINLNKVESSNINRIGYDYGSKILAIEFKGENETPSAIYSYDDVDSKVYEELMQAVSKGSYFYSNVRQGGYVCKKIYTYNRRTNVIDLLKYIIKHKVDLYSKIEANNEEGLNLIANLLFDNLMENNDDSKETIKSYTSDKVLNDFLQCNKLTEDAISSIESFGFVEYKFGKDRKGGNSVDCFVQGISGPSEVFTRDHKEWIMDKPNQFEEKGTIRITECTEREQVMYFDKSDSEMVEYLKSIFKKEIINKGYTYLDLVDYKKMTKWAEQMLDFYTRTYKIRKGKREIIWSRIVDEDKLLIKATEDLTLFDFI